MKILYLAHRIPYPPDKGDKIRAYHEIKFFAGRHSVDVCCLMDDTEDKKFIAPLSKICRNLEVVYIPARLKKLLSLRSVFYPRKTCTELYFYSRKLQDKINNLIKKNSYDLIFVYCSSMMAYVDNHIKSIPAVIDFVDIDSDKWLQYAKYASLPLNMLYSLEGRKLARLERSILRKVKASFLVTERESEFFAEFEGGDRVFAVPNGIDFSFFNADKVASVRELEKERYISFTGAMDYFPNEDGVLYFCQNILPLIWRKIPDLKFYIIGRNPTVAVEKLADDKRIVVTGSVDDVRPYLKHSQLAAIPLRMARGIQNKILEAMAMGLPVVTTSNAFEGLALDPGRDLIVHDQPHKFADAVVELLSDTQAREELVDNARKVLVEKYDWSRNLTIMHDILVESGKA